MMFTRRSRLFTVSVHGQGQPSRTPLFTCSLFLIMNREHGGGGLGIPGLEGKAVREVKAHSAVISPVASNQSIAGLVFAEPTGAWAELFSASNTAN